LSIEIERERERIMSSELQQQVTGNQKGLNKGRESLFLTPEQAARVDVADVHEAAVKGLNALCQYDDRFSVFHERILHPSSVNYQRELKTAEVIRCMLSTYLQWISLLSFLIKNTGEQKAGQGDKSSVETSHSICL
jgi:hypothetical protein